MPADRATSWRLATGLAASLFVHLALLLPGLSAMMSVSAATSHEDAQPEPRAAPPPPPELPPEVTLGIDADVPISMTWIGREEHRQHLAQLAEVEQAAFTAQPQPTSTPPPRAEAAPPSPGEPVETPPPMDPAEPIDLTDPVDVEGSETARARSEDLSDAPPDGSPAVDSEAVSPDPPRSPVAVDPETARELMAFVASRLDQLLRPQRQPRSEAESASDADDAAAETLMNDAAAPASDEAATTSSAPALATDDSASAPASRSGEIPGAGAGAERPGESAEKEADASTLEVPLEEINPGQPLASKGLEIQTRRPEFTTLTRLTATPANPLAQIRFGRDGRPRLVTFIQPSGDSRVDLALEASLYRWRAKGEALTELEEDETINIEIRILLH